MKKLVYSLFIIGFTASSLLAQDDKKVKMGITLTPAMNWLTPDNDKKMTKNGSVIKMGIGLAVDFKLTDVIWFSTGLEYTGAGGKIKYDKDTAMYYYKDDAILSVKPADADNLSSQANQDYFAGKSTANHLLTRTYKNGYLHIPLAFKLKTKELGGITYFGDIGGDLFIKTSSKADDHVKSSSYNATTSTETTTDMDIKNNKLSNEVNFFNAAAHVGAGLEFRLSGSTAITTAVQYRHGIMNYTNSDTYNLLRSTQANSAALPTHSEFPNGTKLRQFVLTVGIMF
jgi:hypothetical protein